MTEVVRLTDEDYDELRRFVARTPKGRAFLREHERRSQKLAAEEVIRLINDLRESWHQHASGVDAATQVEVLRRELQDMSASIVHARREIASLRPKEETEGNDRIVTATNELDAIVQSTERASFDILNAAERMMDLTSKLRAAAAPADICADIENEISNIFTACSFQDLTGQRTTKVVNALRYIEQRVAAMMSIWGADSNTRAGGRVDGPVDNRPDAHLLNGPSDSGVNQDEIDRLLGGTFTPTTPCPPAPPPETAASASPAIAPAPAPAPEPAEAGPAMGQGDIDSLFG
ncbi:MAG: protein phosphatase CheZ [Rhodospirillaceae bacterium]